MSIQQLSPSLTVEHNDTESTYTFNPEMLTEKDIENICIDAEKTLSQTNYTEWDNINPPGFTKKKLTVDIFGICYMGGLSEPGWT